MKSPFTLSINEETGEATVTMSAELLYDITALAYNGALEAVRDLTEREKPTNARYWQKVADSAWKVRNEAGKAERKRREAIRQARKEKKTLQSSSAPAAGAGGEKGGEGR